MKKFCAFVLGLGIGAVVAILLTPKPGHEIRTKIKYQLKKPDIKGKLDKVRGILAKFQVE